MPQGNVLVMAIGILFLLLEEVRLVVTILIINMGMLLRHLWISIIYVL